MNRWINYQSRTEFTSFSAGWFSLPDLCYVISLLGRLLYQLMCTYSNCAQDFKFQVPFCMSFHFGTFPEPLDLSFVFLKHVIRAPFAATTLSFLTWGCHLLPPSGCLSGDLKLCEGKTQVPLYLPLNAQQPSGCMIYSLAQEMSID